MKLAGSLEAFYEGFVICAYLLQTTSRCDGIKPLWNRFVLVQYFISNVNLFYLLEPRIWLTCFRRSPYSGDSCSCRLSHNFNYPNPGQARFFLRGALLVTSPMGIRVSAPCCAGAAARGPGPAISGGRGAGGHVIFFLETFAKKKL